MKERIVFLSALMAASLLAQQKQVFEMHGDSVAFGAMASTGSGAVKNQPYSADVISESVQVLADGNRIVNRSTSFVARDSQGRTRNETRLSGIGSVAIEGSVPKITMIHDPVAKVTYTLDENNKTARKLSSEFHYAPAAAGAVGARAVAGVAVAGDVLTAAIPPPPPPPPARHMVFEGLATPTVHFIGRHTGKAQTESLGTKMIEGVIAEGKRITETIAAGEIGNDREINIVHEVWTAQDLKAVVYSKRSDPRTGEMIYRLANIQRVEPPPSLFEVPADYKLTEGLPTKIRLSKPQED